jgi:hypothetical protein
MSYTNGRLSEHAAATIKARVRIDQTRALLQQMAEDVNVPEAASNLSACLEQLDLLWRSLDRIRDRTPARWKRATVEGLSAEEVYQRLIEITYTLVLLSKQAPTERVPISS